jgi:GTPase SAR1 family protein
MNDELNEGTGAPRAEVTEDAVARHPRVALMGEFSAGKSTLSNLLIGKSALPVNVTATQLPPVWISYGDDAPYRLSVDGAEVDVDPSLDGIAVQDTKYVRVFHEAKFLEFCDLIDMPGISDPNMAAEVWQRVIPEADIIIWCSHATQAWRQSEAAVWGTLPDEFYEKSLLLLTRMDRILSERDQQRVIKRVKSETRGMFREVLPVSLIKAVEASGDPDAWAASGADVLIANLMNLVDEVASGQTGRRVSRVKSEQPSATLNDAMGERVVEKPKRIVMPARVRPRPLVSRTPARS